MLTNGSLSTPKRGPEDEASEVITNLHTDDLERAREFFGFLGLTEEAQRRGHEVVHPLTDEPWGIRRFFVRSPDGQVINVAQHRS